jgi:hypothetical protein
MKKTERMSIDEISKIYLWNKTDVHSDIREVVRYIGMHKRRVPFYNVYVL